MIIIIVSEISNFCQSGQPHSRYRHPVNSIRFLNQLYKLFEFQSNVKIISMTTPTPNIICPACGAATPPGSRFCESCGQKLEAAPTPTAIPTPPAMTIPEPVELPPPPRVEPMKPLVVEAKEKCANCGQPISPDFNRCPYCGAPVVKEEAAPPPVPSPIPPRSDGTPLTPPPPYMAVPTPAPQKQLSTGWIIVISFIAIKLHIAIQRILFHEVSFDILYKIMCMWMGFNEDTFYRVWSFFSHFW